MRASTFFFTAFAVLLVAGGLSGVALGHAEYESSNPPANGILPDPPASVAVTLTEPIRPGAGSIRVTNVSGDRVDVGPVNVSSPSARTMSVGIRSIRPGVYTVTWSAISAVDGHFTAGSFSFGVQNPDGTIPGTFPASGPASAGTPISPLEVILRYFSFLGLSIALGSAVFAAFIWLPSGRDLSREGDEAFEGGFRELLGWARLGGFAFLGGTAGLWVLTLLLSPPASLEGLVDSPFLVSLAAKVVLSLSFLAAVSVVLVRSRAKRAAPNPRLPLLVVVVLGIAALVAGSLGTHSAAAVGWWPWGPVVDAAHLLGASLWVGGLLAIVRVRKRLRGDGTLPFARLVLGRFSRLAASSVAVVLLAGVVLTIILVGSVDALVTRGYGWVVLAKTSLFAPMVALGAMNRYRWLPKAARREEAPAVVRALAKDVRAEAALGAVVLALAAVLTAMTPAISLSTNPSFSLQATKENIRFELQVFPFPTVPGVYTFTLQLWDASTGDAYVNALNATLTFTLLNSTLPSQSVPLEGPHGNHFFVETTSLSKPGTWRIDTRISRVNGFDLRATFHILLGGG